MQEWLHHVFEDENHQSIVAPTVSRGFGTSMVPSHDPKPTKPLVQFWSADLSFPESLTRSQNTQIPQNVSGLWFMRIVRVVRPPPALGLEFGGLRPVLAPPAEDLLT